FGRDAGVAMVILLLGLKLLELRTLRDGLLLILLGYFLAITQFLYSQSLGMAVYLLLATLLLTAALIQLNQTGSRARPIASALRLSTVLLAQAAPIMLVLFFLFPRISGPLWGMPNDALSGVTGLSNEMSPGSISRLSQSDAVAFRVEFQGAPPPPQSLYWRGPVLWRTDGRLWTEGRPAPQAKSGYQGLGQPVSYTVSLEPNDRNWLLALDLPATAPPNARMTADFQVLSDHPVSRRLRYRMSSYLRYRTGDLPPQERQRALQLPVRGNPRTLALAASWRRLGQPEAIVRQALAYYRDRHFSYTLTPPALPGRDPVDRFLFDTRQGFCEHYAGSFVLLMRAAGVPARVVTGYQGGEFNSFARYMIVRQADAHAWAEVWLQGRGWVRIDPTAAAAPERLASGAEAALGGGGILGLPAAFQLDAAWLRKLRDAWDVLNGGWNLWVLGYSQERQLQLLSHLGLGLLSWQDMAIGLMLAVGGLLAVLAFFLLRRNTIKRDPVQAAYRLFCRRLARRGMPRQANEGPLDYAARAVLAVPERYDDIAAIGALYAELRYGTEAAPERVAELRRRVRGFKF
ncbi:MAG: DUF3488 and transglutaminase-like domain-containing protein, partial [Sulfuricellaceae bacterium]|nr:DUF3488 and transglutaminase-like domain-containing protein [Sulfuricellaceae bacterium]